MKEKEYKVSVVTAVYNVEEYLKEMIESIIAQTIGFENIQLILVDDGSKDGSGEICDCYAARYPDNIVALHQENGGVALARNRGLEIAKGKYVNFMDSDDMLEDNALELMYEYLHKNQKWIDVVAIKLVFFGAREGDHPLNYRFSKTRIVDLRKEYKNIQMSMSSALVKRECFADRKFDTELSYAEDAQLMLDILLEKMRYGVVCETSYLYRRREEGGSAINTGRVNPRYYVPYMERFSIYSLENAKKKKGYIPHFIQFTCMYDLQWRFRQMPLVEPGILREEEEERYKALLKKAILYIDDSIIDEQKNINGNLKAAILMLKKENKMEMAVCPDDLRICMGDMCYTAVASYVVFFEFLSISQEEIQLEGLVRYFAGLEDAEVILKVVEGVDREWEYKAQICDRERRYDYCMDKPITQAKSIRLVIPRKELPGEVGLQLCLRYKGNDIVWKTLAFGKFFPLSRNYENSYFFQDGILMTYSDNILRLSKNVNKRMLRRCEQRFQMEILKGMKLEAYKGLVLRQAYRFLRKFKKKEIWMISDRLEKADDNGEVFFSYINAESKKSGIDTYFVINKETEAYGQLQKIGKVVPFHSLKFKMLSLLCDKVVSSQGEDRVFNPFFGQMQLYKDILHHQKFVFLQHGVTKDDLSGWLARTNKNISLFVTSTRRECQSILEYDYGYDERQVKCTGFPRFDCLYDNAKKVIVFMPTWRAYLVGKYDVQKEERILKSGFENSAYCRMYRQVFLNRKLQETVKKYHFELKFLMHPSMPRESIKYLGCEGKMEILDKNTRYRDMFAEAKLVVTDYSSAVFDFAYLGKPVLYYQQDSEEFFSGKHTYQKGYFDYEKDGFGEVEYTAEALVDRLIEYMENGCQLKEVYRKRIEETFPYRDKKNCERVYEAIRAL